MKTIISRWILGLGLLSAPMVHAGPRSSASYSIVTDATDAGGRRATSASYTNDGSVGLVAGISTVAAPASVAKAGYIAQLYEVGGFLVTATPSTLDEGGTRQLEAGYLLDDATLLGVDRTQVSWSILSGPITAISPSGVATAGLVYQHTPAGVRGIFQGDPSSFTLTVLNVGRDDYQSYAGDTLDDDWQVLHFGLPPNLLAGSLLDPDGDGQDNLFEFTAGVVPTDPNSVFRLRIEKVPPPSNDKKLIFSPRFNDRTYSVWFRPNLATPPLWDILTGTTQSDLGTERTVTDPNAIGRKFYRVEITKP